MKRNEQYILKQIENEYFLISSGQAAADSKKILKTNRVGAFVWDALKENISKEHLLKLAMMKYQPGKNEIEGLVKEIDDFLHVLFIKGLISGLKEPAVSAAPLYTNIKIAGIKIKINGDEDLLNDRLKHFMSDDDPKDTDITVNFRMGLPACAENGQVIIRNHETFILENKKHYIIIFNDFKRVRELHITEDLHEADLYALPPYDDELKEEVFLSLRTPFLLNALNKGMIMLHSASVLYKERVICFSASAGTGKSTHASLWKRLFDVKDVNGDLNLLKPSDGSVTVLGTPWCGSSGIFTKESFPLGAIVFLKRDTADHGEELSLSDGFLKITARCISPNWTPDLCVKITDLAEEIAEKTKCYLLNCTMNDSAAEEMKRLIDKQFKSLFQ